MSLTFVTDSITTASNASQHLTTFSSVVAVCALVGCVLSFLCLILLFQDKCERMRKEENEKQPLPPPKIQKKETTTKDKKIVSKSKRQTAKKPKKTNTKKTTRKTNSNGKGKK